MRAAFVVCVFPGLLSSGWNHSDVSNLSSWICTTQFLPSTRTFQKLSTPSPVKVVENSFKCTQHCHCIRVHKKNKEFIKNIFTSWEVASNSNDRDILVHLAGFLFFSNDHFILFCTLYRKKKPLRISELSSAGLIMVLTRIHQSPTMSRHFYKAFHSWKPMGKQISFNKGSLNVQSFLL